MAGRQTLDLVVVVRIHPRQPVPTRENGERWRMRQMRVYLWGLGLLLALSVAFSQASGYTEAHLYETLFTVPAKGDPLFRFPPGLRAEPATISVMDAKSCQPLVATQQESPNKNEYRVVGSSALLFSENDRNRRVLIRVQAYSMRVVVLPLINQSGLDYLPEMGYHAITSAFKKRGFTVVPRVEVEIFLRERGISAYTLFYAQDDQRREILRELAENLNLAFVVLASVAGGEVYDKEAYTIFRSDRDSKKVEYESREQTVKLPSASLTMQVADRAGHRVAVHTVECAKPLGLHGFRRKREEILRQASDQICRTVFGE